jgi:hypothetical protein
MIYTGATDYKATKRLLLSDSVFAADTLRVSGVCIDGDGHANPVADHEAHFWSVYGGEVHAPDEVLTMCLGDFPTRRQAETFCLRLRGFLGADLLLDAMCLWEAVIEICSIDDDPICAAITATRNHHGTVALREAIAAMVPACEAAWRRAEREDGYDEPYDWEWCPSFIRTHVEWDETGHNLPRLNLAQ